MTAQLVIRVPEGWTPAASDARDAFAWSLVESGGREARAGEGGLASLPARPCRIVLPAARVTLTTVRPPAQNRKKFMAALVYAVEDKIMADPETVHVAAGPDLDNGDMPVAVVERDWLRGLLSVLREAGIEPERAEVETLLAPRQENTWTVVLRPRGGFLRQAEYAGMELDGGDGQTPPLALELAVAEGAAKPARIRVFLDGTDQPDLSRWASRLGVPVEFAGRWGEAVPLPERGINLLQGEFAPAGAAREWLARLRPALILGAILILVQVVFSVVDWAMLRHEKSTLNAAIAQRFRTAFPDAKTIVDAPLQMSRNLAALRHAAGRPDRDDFLPLLAELTPVVGSGARVRHLEYRQGNLKADLAMADDAAADKLRKALQAVPGATIQTERSAAGEPVAHVTVGGQR